MLSYDVIEVFEVAGLLVIHVFHQRSKMRMGLDHGRRLSCVYKHGGKLPGLVDTKLVSCQDKTRDGDLRGTYSTVQKVFLLLSQVTGALTIGANLNCLGFGLCAGRL